MRMNMKVCVHLCAELFACVPPCEQRPKVDISHLLLSTLFLETGSLPEPGTPCFS